MELTNFFEAVAYAKKIIKSFVGDEVKLIIEHEEPELGYEFFVSEKGESYIAVGRNILIKEFGLKVRDFPFVKLIKVQNLESNLLGFSILHEIAHYKFRQNFKYRPLIIFDSVCRFLEGVLYICELVSWKISCKDEQELGVIFNRSLKRYVRLPEEVAANKWADENAIFLPKTT